ncbi:MAG: hypothetical protein J2P21_01525 [Chloracidobacterium sp.]|nr:hypothetical protein [Chloracidobacterium sp.]
MRTATAITKDVIPTIEPRQALWLDFHSALARRNFIRAVEMPHRLNIFGGLAVWPSYEACPAA